MSQKIKTSVEIDGSLSASQIANATTDTDKFLVSDGGTIKYRTGAELATDLGISSGTTSKVQHQVKAGVAINKGQAVYVTSADGTNMIVGLASNASEATSSKTMGLLNATVVANGFADVVTEGLLDGLDTSTAAVGNPVWLGTGGNLIYGLANKPYAPNHLVFIGIVTRVNANNGEIFVKVQNGFELDEIHDIDLKTTTKVNGHLLGYNGSLWVNKTIAEWLGYTPYNASNPAGYISSYTETDPTVPSHVKSITTTNISNWNTAYGWGNHASAGYLTSYTETDTLASVTGRGAITSGDIYTPNNGGIFFNGNGVYGSGIFGRNFGQDLGLNAGGLERVSIASNGAVTANVSFRSPIIYDSNDTTYYADFSSTSNSLYLAGQIYTTKSTGTLISINGVDTIGYNSTTGGAYLKGTGNSYIYGGGLYFDGSVHQTLIHTGNISSYAVPTSRTITINGTSYDLSANRSWTVTASETDTLATVTARGNTTTASITAASVIIPSFETAANVLSFRSGIPDGTNVGIRAKATVTANRDGLELLGYNGIDFSINNGNTVAGKFNNYGQFLVNAASSGYGANLYGYNLGMRGNTSQAYMSIALSNQTLDTQGLIVGIDTGYARFHVRDSKPISFANGDVERMTLDTSANLIANGSVRTPIFYDSNNTGFYGDFASTSNFNKLLLNSENSFNTTTPGLTSYGLTLMGGTSDYANGITWTWGNTNSQAGVYVQSSGAYGTKMYFATTDSFATGAKTAMAIDHSGNVSLNRGTFSNGSVWINNGVNYNSYNENIRLFNATNGVSVIAFGASGTSGTPQSSILGFSDRLEIRVGSNGTAVQRNYDNYVEAMGSSRAPIFYDSNNTGYYVDPASTSNLNGLTVAGTISGNVSGTARKINIGSAQTITDLNISVGDAGSVMFDTFQSGALNKPVSGNNANGVLTFSMAHGPQYGKQIAFADDDDLYIRRLSANSYASWRKILHSGNYTSFNYFDMPYGGNEISGMGPITNWDSRPGVGMAGFGINWHTGVSISGYGGYGGVRLYASGYPTHSGSVLRLEASDSVKTYGTFTNDSSVRSPIFYDSNDTTYYVDPAGSATRAAFLNGNLWINPKPESYGEGVTFNMPTQGTWGGLRWYRNGPAGSYAGNWAFGYFGNESNNDVGFHNGTNGWRLDHSFNMTSVGSVRSPVFYDSNDTSYYLDPNNTSRVTAVVADNLYSINNIYLESNYGSSVIGLYNSTRYQGVYSMGSAYKLALDGTTTGNLYGLAWAHPNAGGVSGNLNTHGLLAMENGTWLASLTGSTRARDDMRAPIFYDNNDTTYYSDPASTSGECARFAGGIVVSRGNVTGNGIILADDGDIVDLNDGYCAMRFSSGVRIHAGNRTGGVVHTLHSNGTFTASGDVVAYSDERVKENINTIEYALDKVKALRGVTYNRTDKKDKSEKVGVIAQEIKEVLPQVVFEQEDGMLGVSYGNITAVLIEAIKEQQTQIEELKELVNKLINK